MAGTEDVRPLLVAALERALAGALLARDWRGVAAIVRTWADLDDPDRGREGAALAGSVEEQIATLESVLSALRSQKGEP